MLQKSIILTIILFIAVITLPIAGLHVAYSARDEQYYDTQEAVKELNRKLKKYDDEESFKAETRRLNKEKPTSTSTSTSGSIIWLLIIIGFVIFIVERKSSSKKIKTPNLSTSASAHKPPLIVTYSVNDEENETQQTTKKCPFCAEIIKAEAMKCRYCGENINNSKTKPDYDQMDDTKILDLTDFAEISNEGFSSLAQKLVEKHDEKLKERNPKDGFDPSKRILCSDGACIGLVNDKGFCKVCGKPYKR